MAGELVRAAEALLAAGVGAHERLLASVRADVPGLLLPVRRRKGQRKYRFR